MYFNSNGKDFELLYKNKKNKLIRQYHHAGQIHQKLKSNVKFVIC